MGDPLFLPARGFPTDMTDPDALKRVQDAWQKNIKAQEEWASGVDNQALFPLVFTDSNIAAGVTNQQMRRFVSDGGGTGVQAKVIGSPLPVACGLKAMALASDTSLGAGSATFKLFSGGSVTGAGQLTWSGGTSKMRAFDPGTYILGAGAVVDLRVTTTGTFSATGADIEVVCYFQQIG